MGKRLISLKGQSQAWRGQSRLSTNDRGQRTFLKLENCYVSQDGAEIRAFPGYATLIDLTTINNANGYERWVPDVVRPVMSYDTPNAGYWDAHQYAAADTQTLWSRAKPVSFFGFEQIGNNVYIIGESRFREDAVYGADREHLEIKAIRSATLTAPGDSRFALDLNATPTEAARFDDSAGANTLTEGHVVWVSGASPGVTFGDSRDDMAAEMFAQLNDHYHVVEEIDGKTVYLLTQLTGTGAGDPLTVTPSDPVRWGRIRPNRSNNYPTPGTSVYAATPYDRPDDPEALTVWRVSGLLDIFDTGAQNACYPAWVANRQRDCGDGTDNTTWCEGIVQHTNSAGKNVRGCSRREQLRLPYRPVIEPALNRIILAAPQYGCMFQIPAIVPTDPSLWPDGDGSSALGSKFPNNNIYDKPRSLGVPKARLVETVLTAQFGTPAAQTTPDNNGFWEISSSARVGSPEFGLDAGTYKFAIAFVDPGTGEEGLASEVIEVAIPDGTYADYAYTLTINYVHPGYYMGECLALRMNVYIAPPGEDALGFYGSYELMQDPRLKSIVFVGSTTEHLSAHYGFGDPPTPTEYNALIRRFDLPLPSQSGDIADRIDFSRLAPQSATMPRGASACKYIRGVLFSGGALGNAGRNGELWKASATSGHKQITLMENADEFFIRAHTLADAGVPSGGTLDGTSTEGTLGIAGRAFPDAYQGIDFIGRGLIPGSDTVRKIDRVLNRGVTFRQEFQASYTNRQHHLERMRLVDSAYDRNRVAGVSPGDVTVDFGSHDVFYVMPRGQLQIGDPGAPWRASRAFVKIVDPNRGDDITAIGQLGGSAIVCTAKETYSYSWYRNPGGEEANLMSAEFGCIAPNSMVEFDGGLAWISERGPVALGDGLQFIGADVSEDFYGQSSRYLRDSRGMMRACWSYHDQQRGLVMWGLLTRESGIAITQDGTDYSALQASLFGYDEILSRFPCDEVLVWSYRAGAFSTWRPPTGLDVYWMRSLRDKYGFSRTCFLSHDQRIYAMDDVWNDRQRPGSFGAAPSQSLLVSPRSKGSASTTFEFTASDVTWTDGESGAGRNNGILLLPGMLVEFLNPDGEIYAETTIASVVKIDQSSPVGSGYSSITLSAAATWGGASEGYRVRIGGRQRGKIISSYIGAETMDTINVQRVQMRYTLAGIGSANARVKLFKVEDGSGEGEESRVVTMTKTGVWESLGWPKDGSSVPSELLNSIGTQEVIGRRKSFSNGQASAPEIAVQIEFTGDAQVRIQDIALEVG